MRVERLTPQRRDDFLRFFEHLGDTGTPLACEAAACCCHYYHTAIAILWQSLAATENRTAMTARLDAGEMDGFLAYDGTEVVGWLNAQPYQKLSHLRARLAITSLGFETAPYNFAAVTCFVVAPSCQRHEVARALLDSALLSLRQRGIHSVDAFPRTSAGDAPQHPDPGPLSLFVAAGFAVLGRENDLTLVRKVLA